MYFIIDLLLESKFPSGNLFKGSIQFLSDLNITDCFKIRMNRKQPSKKFFWKAFPRIVWPTFNIPLRDVLIRIWAPYLNSSLGCLQLPSVTENLWCHFSTCLRLTTYDTAWLPVFFLCVSTMFFFTFFFYSVFIHIVSCLKLLCFIFKWIRCHVKLLLG